MGGALAKAEATVSVNVNQHLNTTLNTGGFILLINNVVIVLAITSVVLTYFFRKQCIRHVSTLLAVVILIVLSLILFAASAPGEQEDIPPVAEPVYSWKSSGKHTFHFRPAWEGEAGEPGEIQFYAYRDQQPGTEAIMSYWDYELQTHTFHFAPEWEGESEFHGVAFYAFRAPVEGTEAVWDFIGRRGGRTVHFPPSWPGERRGGIQFYAFRAPPCQALPGRGAHYPVVVPVVAYLLGIAAATIVAACYKWSTGEGLSDDLGFDALPGLLSSGGGSKPKKDHEPCEKPVRIVVEQNGVTVFRDIEALTEEGVEERSALLKNEDGASPSRTTPRRGEAQVAPSDRHS